MNAQLDNYSTLKYALHSSVQFWTEYVKAELKLYCNPGLLQTLIQPYLIPQNYTMPTKRDTLVKYLPIMSNFD
jgi:hypothetical protein